MKKTLVLLALAGIASLPANAQLGGDGYYRIRNAKTGRYMTLSDNHSRGVNVSSTQAETGALETRRQKSDIISDPGSVFYIQNVGGREYNIKAQGADMHSMTQYYINLAPSSYVKGAYRAYQTSSGYTLYLADRYSTKDNSFVTTEAGSKSEPNERDWEIIPVSTQSDNFIGITPVANAGGKYYASYYAGFAYNFASSGMKAYYISKIDEQKGIAVYSEISTSTVPAMTPVIIECSAADASGNKIEPLASSSLKAVAGNSLQGVLFSVGNFYSNHYNAVRFDAATMRTIGAENGKLVFNNQKDNMSYIEVCLVPGSENNDDYVYDYTIPHNSCYIKVAASTASTLQLMSEEEYKTTGVAGVVASADDKPADVYSTSGVLVRRGATSVDGLAKGVYIFRGKKVVVE